MDLRSGDAPHWVRFTGQVEELYDVAVLTGAWLSEASGFQTDDIRHQVWCDNDASPPIHWSAGACS